MLVVPIVNRMYMSRCWRRRHAKGTGAQLVDQALFQYERFAGFDGQFLDNVVLQNKNGPCKYSRPLCLLSFLNEADAQSTSRSESRCTACSARCRGAQPRRRARALLLVLTQVHTRSTNQMVEFEATQEYLGQAKHVCHLPSQWKTYLDFDTAAPGGTASEPQTMARVVSGQGGAKPHPFAGTAAVSNLGDDPTWTGHEFSAANTCASLRAAVVVSCDALRSVACADGYGRLAWDPSLSAKDVTQEWVAATWGADPKVVSTLTSLLLHSWQVFENYTAPLGVGFICGGDHYDPDPPHRESYTNASSTRIGFRRGFAAGYGGTYNAKVAAQYDSVSDTPEELLLCFHNVPYTHKLSAKYGGLSVLGYIYASHASGAQAAADYVTAWQSLRGLIDEGAYGTGVLDTVEGRLKFGASEAKRFSSIIVDYFANLTHVPPTERGR